MSKYGEVIEATTQEFTAGCLDDMLFQPPEFGSFVKVRAYRRTDLWTYAVVYAASTASEPPGSSAAVRGGPNLSDDDIYQQYPDIRVMMRTRFRALVVGFREGEAIHQYLPPQPVPLHYSVELCSPDEVRAFTQGLTFLRTILASPSVPGVELVAAVVRQAQKNRPHDPTFIQRASRELARLLLDDYDRLRAILARLQ